MADLEAIVAGIKARLDTIPKLNTFAFEPDDFSVPAAWVGEFERIDYDLTLRRGADQIFVPIRVAVSKASDRSRHKRLNEYASGTGERSIKEVIEGDSTLGGAAHSVRVSEARNFGTNEAGGVEYWGCEFLLEIVA